MMWNAPNFTDRKIEGSELMAIILFYKLGLCLLTETGVTREKRLELQERKDWWIRRELWNKSINENLNFNEEEGQ